MSIGIRGFAQPLVDYSPVLEGIVTFLLECTLVGGT